MEAIRVLAEEIGPRPACSQAEHRAARWAAARLGGSGYEVTVEDFPSRPSYFSAHASYFLIAALGALLAVPLPLVGLVLGVTGFVLYAREVDGRPLVRRHKGISHNVVARPHSADVPQLVVVAHLDSALASLPFHPKIVNALRPSLGALRAALFLAPLSAAAAWLSQAEGAVPSFLWLPALGSCAYLSFTAALLIHAQRKMRAVAGANGNASGVEVLMRVAASVPGPGVWFVLTGSGGSGMIGIQSFLDEHDGELGNARFLNLDSVGAGTLVATTEEGLLRERRADRAMWSAAEDAGAESRPFRTFPTDATALIARRFRATTLIGLDDDDLVPNWHTPADILGNIDPEAIDRAERVARALVSEMARGVATP
ncbi:MAG: hypothetical protein QOH26_784 [Actinomycetota bacterium]|jgi:hypothetical protein|nr:hypothetical protein [Actinomycetota bacterium]